MLKIVQIIERVVDLSQRDDIIDQQNLQKLASLVHFYDRKVREAAGSLLLTISDEFEDGAASLLPLQIIADGNPQKIEKRRGIQLQLPFQMADASMNSEQNEDISK